MDLWLRESRLGGEFSHQPCKLWININYPFQGYVFYLGLESYDLVTLSGFLYFWGFVFLAATTLVAIFKTENEEGSGSSSDEEPELGDLISIILLCLNS